MCLTISYILNRYKVITLEIIFHEETSTKMPECIKMLTDVLAHEKNAVSLNANSTFTRLCCNQILVRASIKVLCFTNSSLPIKICLSLKYHILKAMGNSLAVYV